MSMMSPMFRPVTSSAMMGSAPASSMVLKKMGAMVPPMQTQPNFLLGTAGFSSPMSQRMEFVADLREEPVPTTSPTYVRGKPFFLSSATCFWQSEMPSRGFFSMARACKGMSGRDHASWAGERSSVLVSPVTLKTHMEIFLGTTGREVNHSASAQLFITCSAYLFPFFIFSSTSYLDSNIKIVLESASAAIGATAGSSKAATKGATLYPPIILPSISVATALVMRGDVASPLTMAARKPAFT
mmetsp:Transcript_46004/g.116827  ORF Transcript_46004/g.116827 Transcript_46004/m.116827 type:complete len:242 (-) Transcript_46004:378-1103(-)